MLTALTDVEDALVALRGDRESLSSLQLPPRRPATLRCWRACATTAG